MVTSLARVRHPVVSLARSHPSRPACPARPHVPAWRRRGARCTLAATRTCSTKGLSSPATNLLPVEGGGVMTEVPPVSRAGTGLVGGADALAAEPARRVGRRWIALIALANLGLY